MVRKRKGSPTQHQSLVQALLGTDAAAGKPLTPQQMIHNLQEQGFRIVKEDPLQTRRQSYKIKTASAERFAGGKTIRFGVVSDTQFGSRKQQLTFLHVAYDRFAAKGIDTVLHCGDLVDGDGRVYPGQEFDLFIHGYDRQLDYAEEHYPSRQGITTYLIAGNHDWSFHQRKGADILAALAKRRPDIKYLGPMAAKLTLDGIKIQLIHLKSGLTYARSYKLQKIIEQLAPQEKPQMLFAGDRHSWAHIPMYRNVYGWQLGCFQSQTEHEKRLGLYPEIGALIVEADYATKGADNPTSDHDEGRPGIVAVRHESIPFFIPKENDY